MLLIHVLRAYLAIRKLRRVEHTHTCDIGALLQQEHQPERPRVVLVSSSAPQLPLPPPSMN
jgi:hypothetical protein